jgi:hypothetical protein
MAQHSTIGPLASPVHGPLAGLVRWVAAIALVVTMVVIWLAHQLGLRRCCWLQPSQHSRGGAQRTNDDAHLEGLIRSEG